MSSKHEHTGTPGDALLTALYLEAEETRLPNEPAYDVDEGLQRFSSWLDGRATPKRQLRSPEAHLPALNARRWRPIRSLIRAPLSAAESRNPIRGQDADDHVPGTAQHALEPLANQDYILGARTRFFSYDKDHLSAHSGSGKRIVANTAIGQDRQRSQIAQIADEIDCGSRRHQRLPNILRRVPVVAFVVADALLLLYFFPGVTNVDRSNPVSAALAFAALLAAVVIGIGFAFFRFTSRWLQQSKADTGADTYPLGRQRQRLSRAAVLDQPIRARPHPGPQRGGRTPRIVVPAAAAAAVIAVITVTTVALPRVVGSAARPAAPRSSSPSPSPSSTVTLPAAVDGTWSGSVHQGSNNVDTVVKLDGGSPNGTVTFSGTLFTCAGSLKLKSAAHQTFTMSQRIVAGTCLNGVVTLRQQPGGALKFHFKGVSSLAATGTLTRQ